MRRLPVIVCAALVPLGQEAAAQQDNTFDPDDVVTVGFTIGDHSGSHSERWQMTVSGGPTTLQPQSPDYGEVDTISLNQFRKGKEYSLAVGHLGTHPQYTASTQDESEETLYLGQSWYDSPSPDYDYQAELGSDAGGYVKDPDGLLGTSNGSETNEAEGKSVAFGFPKPILEFQKPGEEGILTEEEEEDPGVVIMVNDNDSNEDGLMDMYNPYGAVDPEMVPVGVGVEIDGTLDIGTVTMSAGGPGKVRLWDSSDMNEPIELPRTWDMSDPEERAAVSGTYYLEGLAASSAARDTTLSLSYSGNLPGTTTEDVKLTLLSVDIREAWSDQITDVEANGMPNKTGNANKAYILMGVRADGKAHGKLRLGTAFPDGVRSKMLWRFQKKSGGAPEAGSSSYEQEGLVVRMTMDNAANADDKDYVVVVGFDANGDGSLAASEVSMTPTTKHDPPDGGVNPTEMPFTFTVVSTDRYEESRTENLNTAGNSAVQLTTPNAAELLTTFCNGGNAPNASNVSQVTIERTYPGLTHPVGIVFTPTAEPGQSVRFEFDGNTDFAKDFTKTDRFRNALLDELQKPEWIQRIAEHYLDEQGNPINPLDEDVWFSWTWEAITGKDNLDFRGAISSPQDLDMWVALGKVKISGTVSVKANWLNQEVSEMRFTGTVEDVYDFDYDDDGIAIGNVQIRPKLAAEVQSGHPTLTPGGRVVLTLLQYDDSNLNLTYQFFGL